MKKISQSLLLLLLTASFARAVAPEELLKEAIEKGNYPAVRELTEAGNLDLNKGLGSDLKPSLVLAIENLGTELKEHPRDVAWYAIAAGFSGVAIYGAYELLIRNDEQAFRVSLPESTKPATPVLPTTPITEPSVTPDSSRDGSESDIAPTTPAPVSVTINETVKVEVKTKPVKPSGAKRFLNGFKNLALTGGAAAAVAGAIKKAKEAVKPSRTPWVEERLKIVKFLAQQPSINIFAADNSGRNALDLVITYLSSYQPGSECYTCMEEAKKSITERSIREVYELYGELSKNLDMTTCTDGCSCHEGGDCICTDKACCS